jgi:hypothetical protein
MMNDFSAADLTVQCRARVAKDGRRILCDARNNCSGVLGELMPATSEIEHGEVDGEDVQIVEETVIVLPAGIAPTKAGPWRRTQRPEWRGETRHLKHHGKAMKFSDKPVTVWGTHRFNSCADYILPVEVVCPRCKRVNLITDALIPRP